MLSVVDVSSYPALSTLCYSTYSMIVILHAACSLGHRVMRYASLPLSPPPKLNFSACFDATSCLDVIVVLIVVDNTDHIDDFAK